MVRKRSENEIEPWQHLVVELPLSHKNLLRDAAKAGGFANLSEFVRSVTLERAQAILAGQPVPSKPPPTATATHNVLYAYIGAAPPPDAPEPAAAFPSVRAFASAFSDRNRAMLRHLASETPDSIHALAQALDYNYESLSRNVALLAGYGVLACEDGPGAHLVPRLLVRGVRLLVPLKSRPAADPLDLEFALKSEADEPVPKNSARIFPSMETFASAFPGSAHRLMMAIASARSATIPALAEAMGQDTANLYKLAGKLQKLALIAATGRHPRAFLPICDRLVLGLLFAEHRE